MRRARLLRFPKADRQNCRNEAKAALGGKRQSRLTLPISVTQQSFWPVSGQRSQAAVS